jgi:hypothetical protein
MSTSSGEITFRVPAARRRTSFAYDIMIMQVFHMIMRNRPRCWSPSRSPGRLPGPFAAGYLQYLYSKDQPVPVMVGEHCL